MKLRDWLLARLEHLQRKILDEVDDMPPEFYENVMKELKKDCSICRNWGSKSCPPSIECYAAKDKPHFEPKEEDGFWKRIFKRR